MWYWTYDKIINNSTHRFKIISKKSPHTHILIDQKEAKIQKTAFLYIHSRKSWHVLILMWGVISHGSHLHLHMLTCAVSLPMMPWCNPVITSSPPETLTQRTASEHHTSTHARIHIKLTHVCEQELYLLYNPARNHNYTLNRTEREKQGRQATLVRVGRGREKHLH